MLNGIEIIKPEDIEKRSFEIITEILGGREFPPMHGPIIKRVILLLQILIMQIL